MERQLAQQQQQRQFASRKKRISIPKPTVQHRKETQKTYAGDTCALYPDKHFIAALAVGAASLFFNQKTPILTIEILGYDITVFCLCLISGVLIDLDHLVDFQLNKWHRHESLETQFENGRMYVPLHGIENIPILTAVSIIFPFLIFPTLSYILHMTLDICSNNVAHKAYFYALRLRKIITKP